MIYSWVRLGIKRKRKKKTSSNRLGLVGSVLMNKREKKRKLEVGWALRWARKEEKERIRFGSSNSKILRTEPNRTELLLKMNRTDRFGSVSFTEPMLSPGNKGFCLDQNVLVLTIFDWF